MATVVDALDARSLSAEWYIGTYRRRVAVLTGLAIVLTFAFAALVLLYQIISAVAFFTWLLIGAIAWRPRVGLYVTWGLVLLFEAGGPDLMMLPGGCFHTNLSSTTGLPGLIASPLELLLLLTFGIWLMQGLVRHRFDFRPGR